MDLLSPLCKPTKEYSRIDVLHHFLHIRKTGGTAVKHAIGSLPAEARSGLRLQNHGVTLMMIPEGERVIFTTRDPVDRFISGFYSRRREGKPRYNVAWSAGEEVAFAQFDTPNQLAAALSSRDEETRIAARSAMSSIEHVRSSYWDWFGNEAYFFSRAPDIAFIARQECLDEDFESLKGILGLPADLQLPDDDLVAHRNPKDVDRHCDELAARTLKEWYARDYVFIAMCREMRMKIAARAT